MYWLPGDRACVPARGGNSEDDTPDEKITVVYQRDHTVVVKYADGEQRDVPISDLLIDQDHQTELDLEKMGKGHTVSLGFSPSPVIDPVAKEFSNAHKFVKLRLDVVALLFDAVSMYPSTGTAIDLLIKNIPRKPVPIPEETNDESTPVDYTYQVGDVVRFRSKSSRDFEKFAGRSEDMVISSIEDVPFDKREFNVFIPEEDNDTGVGHHQWLHIQDRPFSPLSGAVVELVRSAKPV